jgi:hypothetical protein
MTDRIPEIVLRMAREQLAADAAAADLTTPEPDLIAPDSFASEDTAGAPEELTGSGVSADSCGRDGGLAVTMTFSSDPPYPPLRRGGMDGAAREQSATRSPEVGDPRPAVSPIGDWRAISPASVPRDPHCPALLRGGEAARQAAPFRFGDAVQPGDHSDNASDNRGVHQLLETIADHGRRFEEVLSDLEQSLAALFTTQIETLQRLRDQARDHDRRWTEQSANRRTAFSPP